MPLPTPRARAPAPFAKTVLDYVSGVGGSPARVRAGMALSDADVTDPDGLIDLDLLAELTTRAAREIDDETLGLRLGGATDLRTMGLFPYAVFNAPTVGAGLSNFCRYLGSVLPGGKPSLRVRGATAILSVQLIGIDSQAARYFSDSGLVILLRIMRRLTSEEWSPRKIHFQHSRPKDLSAYTSLLPFPLRFDQAANELHFASNDLDLAVPEADRILLPIVERELAEVLDTNDDASPWLARLRLHVASVVCDGHPKIETVSAVMGMGVRTFQRQLEMRGLVYRDLVAGIRCELACRYLSDSPAGIGEIAFLLGYSDLSAFEHAFHRWTDCSPGAYRRMARARSRNSADEPAPHPTVASASVSQLVARATKRRSPTSREP